jgi:tRNA(Ile)-lysidine synthase
MDLPGGLTGHREYDTIVLRNQNAPKPEKRWDWQPVQLLVPGVTDVGDGDLSVEASLEEPVFPVSGAGSDTAFFDADSVGTRFFVRPVMAGDAIKPLGMEGHKKISDIFTDDKVPRAARDKAVVIETGGAVVWLVGHRTSEYCKITDKTKRVIRLIVSRGDA